MMRTKRLNYVLYFVIVPIALLGCSATAPLYVIDVQKLTGATPDTADQLLKEMVPCQLFYEEHWEEGQTDTQAFIGKPQFRTYHIENGHIDKWKRKTSVTLFFDPEYEERVHRIQAFFIRHISKSDALRRLGYAPKARIKHRYSQDAWYFITQEYLHQVYLEGTDQSTAVTIHLDALTH